MNRGLIALGLMLAAAPCAYAGFIYGWQLVSFMGLAVRLDEALPLETCGRIALVAGQMIVVFAALLIVWQGAVGRNYRKAGVALAVAWLASAPLLVLMLAAF